MQGFWTIVFNMANLVTPVEKSNFYMSHFPSFLQSHITLLLISFLCCLAAFIMSALSLNKLKSNLKWLAYVIIAVSFLVGSLSMFQMM